MVSISLKVAVGNHSAALRLHFLTFKSSVEQETTLQELLKNDAAECCEQDARLSAAGLRGCVGDVFIRVQVASFYQTCAVSLRV